MKEEFIFYMDVLADESAQNDLENSFPNDESGPLGKDVSKLNEEAKTDQPKKRQRVQRKDDPKYTFKLGRWTPDEHE